MKAVKIGEVHNYWTVIGESVKGDRYAKVECRCGSIKDRDVYSLKSGASKSCGCHPKAPTGKEPLDITGQVYGKLTAVKPVSNHKEGSKWLMSCECGGSRVVRLAQIRTNRKATKCCGCTTKGSPVEVGMKFSCPTGDFSVVEHVGADIVKVVFSDGFSYNVAKGNVRSGSIRNPNFPVLFGVGFQGVGNYLQHNVKAYDYWAKMLQRAYCPIYKSEHPSYEGVIVCEEWHNYQNFAKWVTGQVGYGSNGYNLDKDRLIKGNKVYSPNMCLLIPQELNKLVAAGSVRRGNSPVGTSTRPDLNGQYMARHSKTGSGRTETYLGLFPTAELAFYAYKEAKESYIKERTEFWKDSMDIKAYQALMKYEVLITD